MSKGIEQGVTNLIRHWSELAKLAKLSASQFMQKPNNNQTLPLGVSNGHDYYRGVADAFKQASIEVETLLNNSDDTPSASSAG